MRNNKVFRFFILLLISSTSSAYAGIYAGASYTYMIADGIGSEEYAPTALMIKGGYELHKYLAVELRGGTGITDGKRTSSGVDRTLEIKSFYGGYLKLQSGGKSVNPYLMVGYTKGDVDFSVGATQFDDNDSSVSYGIGVDGEMSENTYLNFEYMNYYDKDDLVIHGIGLGFVMRY